MTSAPSLQADVVQADVVIVGGAVMGSSAAYHLLADSGFKGRVVVIEKDPDLPALGLGPVGGLDPPAIFERGEHPHLALRNRFPAQHRRPSRGRWRAAGDRAEGGRLSLLRVGGRRVDPRREPRAPDGRGRRHSLSRSCRAEGALPLAQHGGSRRRHLGPLGRRLVRRLGPAPGLPQEGARARRRIREGRGGRDRARRRPPSSPCV